MSTEKPSLRMKKRAQDSLSFTFPSAYNYGFRRAEDAFRHCHARSAVDCSRVLPQLPQRKKQPITHGVRQDVVSNPFLWSEECIVLLVVREVFHCIALLLELGRFC